MGNTNFRLFYLLIFLAFNSFVQSQNWKTYVLTGIGKISIPPTLELRDENSLVQKIYDHTINQIEKTYNIEFPPATMTFQPVGLNLNGKSENYSRIILTTSKSKKNEYPESRYLFTIGETEKNKLEEFFKTETVNSLRKINIEVLKWFKPEIININGISAYKMSYNRRLGSNPVVYVEVYKIFNNDMSIDLTLSYRVEESEIWSSDFSQVIKKLYINKR
jgi:hypothetical protein